MTTGSGTTDLISDADTELRQSNPTTNYGTANFMGIIVAADEMRGIVQWDLSAYQPDVTVTAAKLRFNVNTANANLLVSVYEALQSWTEGVGTNGSDATGYATTPAKPGPTPAATSPARSWVPSRPRPPAGWRLKTPPSSPWCRAGWMALSTTAASSSPAAAQPARKSSSQVPAQWITPSRRS